MRGLWLGIGVGVVGVIVGEKESVYWGTGEEDKKLMYMWWCMCSVGGGWAGAWARQWSQGPMWSLQASSVLEELRVRMSIRRLKRGIGMEKRGGRNNRGRITVWGRGGGQKQKYREVKNSYKSEKGETKGQRGERVYDSRRTGALEVVRLSSGKGLLVLKPKEKEVSALTGKAKEYMLTREKQEETDKGRIIEWGSNRPEGSIKRLGDLRIGERVYNVEYKRGKGGKIARAGGTYVQCIGYSRRGKMWMRLSSGVRRELPTSALGRKGVVEMRQGLTDRKDRREREDHRWKTAGRSRRQGKTPKVRGVAKNPVDHPHGGGEGRTKGGRPSVTPWGRRTK